MGSNYQIHPIRGGDHKLVLAAHDFADHQFGQRSGIAPDTHEFCRLGRNADGHQPGIANFAPALKNRAGTRRGQYFGETPHAGQWQKHLRGDD
jgi:hypothetical protein